VETFHFQYFHRSKNFLTPIRKVGCRQSIFWRWEWQNYPGKAQAFS
jgi:hypothetical protein